MSEWFSSFANQALQFADSLADSLVTQANEAQQQIATEQNKLKEEEDLKNSKMNSFSSLPWETDSESLGILSQDLMEKILSLSVNEENFIIQSGNASEVYFSFKDFIPMAMNLLKIDSNLARMHSKLSPKMEEETFWFNYYCRVAYLRESSGIDGQQAKINSQKYKFSDVIFESLIVPATSSDIYTNSVHELPIINTVSTTIVANYVGEKESSFMTEEEIKLAAEVRAALTTNDGPISLNNGDDLEDVDDDDDDIDLDDLDDLLEDEDDEDGLGENESGPTASTDFEQIGRSDCDADDDDELEAQIARELADK
jgi:hypothetical protein